MTEKMEKLKNRVEEAIPEHYKSYEVEYWKEEGEDGETMFHGLDLVSKNDYIELYYEEVGNPYKDYEEAIEYISGMLYQLAKSISDIQDNLPHRHRSIKENVEE